MKARPSHPAAIRAAQAQEAARVALLGRLHHRLRVLKALADLAGADYPRLK